MAARAASLTSTGAGKSGKPCARLTALWCMARRVISRMTDSVNWPAFIESDLRAACAIVAADGLASRGGVIGTVYRCLLCRGLYVLYRESSPCRGLSLESP